MDILLDSGVKTYKINGCEVKFNPTDTFFMQRLFNVYSELETKADEWEKEYKAAYALPDKEGARKVFELARHYDRVMREILDEAVGAPICEAVAGDINIFAANSDDIPIYASILFTLLAQTDDGFTRMEQNPNPKIEKYLAKYKK